MQTSILEDAAALSRMAINAEPVTSPLDDLQTLRDLIRSQFTGGKMDSFVFVAADKLICCVRDALEMRIDETAPDDRPPIDP